MLRHFLRAAVRVAARGWQTFGRAIICTSQTGGTRPSRKKCCVVLLFVVVVVRALAGWRSTGAVNHPVPSVTVSASLVIV